jgi:guanylate kinase
MPSSDAPAPIILIISGPAGSGKTTLCERLLAEFPERVERVVTTTSRLPRPGERDGVDYHFLPAEAFEQRIQQGAFIEWAKVHGRYYGSQKDHVLEMLRSGRDLLLNIDVQGARSFLREPAITATLPGRLRTVFIKPASMQQIRERLQGRGADDEEEISRRLLTAAREIAVAGEFDHIIVSGTRDADYAALRALYLEIRK